MDALTNRARELLSRQLAVGAERDRPPDSPYAQLDVALQAALDGDASAAPTLMRVFTESFAVSNSLYEQGCAALGLALLGAREVLPHLQRAPLINLNREAIPLAVELLTRAR